MTTGFAILLFAALALSALLSWLQRRAYVQTTQRLSDENRDSRDRILVSGRGKGILRGAIAVLVVDTSSRRIVAAEAMIGGSIFARFHPRPELLGPCSSAASRAGEKRLAQAVDAAITQSKNVATTR
jgi:Glucitol operon activator